MRIAVAGGTGTVGRHVVDSGRSAGHEMVEISRSSGLDLMDPRLEREVAVALSGVDVLVDTTDAHSLARSRAAAFFEEAAGRLQRSAAAQGVAHIVALSIVGVERVPGFGYYEAKLRHEEVVRAGPVPATVVRATQFHELPVTMMRATRKGPIATVLAMRTQPIAAASVGHYLLETAVGATARPGGGILEIAGPEQTRLVDMARRFAHYCHQRVLVVAVAPPGAAGRALRSGAVLPGPDVPRLGPTFDQWLAHRDGRP